ncbi:cadherin-like domain-containing protein [Lewinella sp. 4G2]|uniref:Ig-like domain-containing protein n=1 Tax=Lewinella sp. 4G2 TaxID=1803372 RepID=UPI001E5CEFC7|nr:cadherin-like domain-containing protein [Lewinella sp. 4G2]
MPFFVTATNAQNSPPVAVDDDQFRIREDIGPTGIEYSTLLRNDFDPDGNALRITGFDFGDFPGTIADQPDDESILFTTAPNFSGIIQFTYTITDGLAESSATITLNILEDGRDALVSLNGTFEVRSSVTPEFLASPRANENRAGVILRQCGAFADTWNITDLGNGYHRVALNQDGNRSLESWASSGPVDRVNASIYRSNGQPWQQWRITQSNDGTYQFVNRWNPRLLSEIGGALLVTDRSTFEAVRQNWELNLFGTVPCETASVEGLYEIVPFTRPYLGLTTDGTTNRSDVLLTFDVENAPRWRVTAAGDGLYAIHLDGSNQSLESYSRSGPNATDDATTYRFIDRPWQRWAITPDAERTNGVRITQEWSGKVLFSTDDVSLEDGTGSVDELWILRRVAPTSPMASTIQLSAPSAGAYPSPFTTELTVTTAAGEDDGIQQLIISDLNGRVLQRVAGNAASTQRIDLGALPSGSYLLRTELKASVTNQIIVKQ